MAPRSRSPRRQEALLAFDALHIEGGLLAPEWLTAMMVALSRCVCVKSTLCVCVCVCVCGVCVCVCMFCMYTHTRTHTVSRRGAC